MGDDGSDEVGGGGEGRNGWKSWCCVGLAMADVEGGETGPEVGEGEDEESSRERIMGETGEEGFCSSFIVSSLIMDSS